MRILSFSVELALTLKTIMLAFIISWYRFLVKPRRKCVEGEVVLVTGGGSGMGREISLQFSKLGATVVIWDLNEDWLHGTEKLLRQTGGSCHSYVCDIGDREQVIATCERVKADVGDVTILVNNAGVVNGSTLLKLKDEDIERTFNVNLLGHIWVTKQFLPCMLENNHGHIVNMASSCGLIGLSHLTDYSASKFGLVGFTEVLSYEIEFSGHDGIHTTLVCPSFVKTGLFDGCQMEYPLILPDLELQPTVARIMQAILTNQTHLCIPRLVYIMAALKTVLPSSALLEIKRFLRADRFMENFLGRSMSKDLSSTTATTDAASKEE